MTHALLNPRRTGESVRRDSYDVDDKRADVFRPIEHGLAFVDHYLQVFDDWRNLIKRKGEPHALNANCRAVLQTILKRCTDYKTGLCEPSLDALQRLTMLSRATIVQCLRRLCEHGFINWVRRTERTGNLPGQGPLVRQVSNAYFFDMKRLPERAFKWLKEKLRRKGKAFNPPEYAARIYTSVRDRRLRNIRQRREDLANAWATASPEAMARHLYPGDEAAQAEHVEALRASSASSLNPSPRILRE